MRYLASDARHVALIAGRGAGKTYAGAVRLLVHATRTPSRYLALAPTYADAVGVVLPALRRLADHMRLPTRWIASQRILHVADSHVLLASADAAHRIRGHEFSGAWVDEAALVRDDTLADWLPAIRIGHAPWIAMTTTPRGRRGWVWQRCQSPDTCVIHAQMNDNPHLDPAAKSALERDLATSPHWSAQELRGEFVDAAGAEWPAELWADEWYWTYGAPPLDRAAIRTIGIDPSLGTATGDYSAIVALALIDGLVYVQADIARRPPHQIVADAITLAHHWRPHVIGVEAVAFQALLAREFALQSRGRWAVAAVKADGPKPLRIRRIGPLIVHRQLRVVHDASGQALVQQLRDWPLATHDDGPDALEIALRLAHST